MLSTFLSQLQSFYSKYFVVGSFCPMLAFTFVNGLTAYVMFPKCRAWLDPIIANATVGRGAFLFTSFLVTTALGGYVLSSLSTFLRRVFEGKVLGRAARHFVAAQNRRRERLINEIVNVTADMVDLGFASTWEKEMRDARDAGRLNKHGVKYKVSNNDDLDEKLKEIEAAKAKNEVIKAENLEDCVGKVTERLAECDVDRSLRVEAQHRRLVALIDYAKGSAKAHHSRLVNELHSNFGVEDVAPTKMGNVANTIQGYALRRYHCNLEAIWSNLQRVAQKDEKSLAALQEAKTQLDFLVASSWLTLIWSGIWALIFSVVAPKTPAFLVAALGGPLIAYMWYRAAAEQYRSFADIAMTTLDAFRFDLLKDFRLSAPADVEGERYLWENIDQLTTFGEDRNFRYETVAAPTQPAFAPLPPNAAGS